jgi:hypothetical protein
MSTMRSRREGLLAQIEASVVDDAVPLSSLLQTCLVLGGQAGSEKMRDWARHELNGYGRAPDSLPDYRRIPAPMTVRITNRAGYNPITQRVYNADLHDAFTRKYNVEEAILGGGIGELEALAKSGEKEHHFSPGWSSLLVEMLNTFQMDESSKVTAAYWTVSNATIQGLLVRVRTALAELVAELVTLTPEDQVVPDKGAADAAVQLVITGDRNTINYSPQHAADGGTNALIGALAAGPVTVSRASGTAIGSQAAGDNSSVVGSQAVHGNRNTVTGQDTTTGAVGNQEPRHENWWTRLRQRGVLVAFFTIVGGIAGVVGAVAAVLTLLGWTPWS